MRVETIGNATLYLGDCRDILPTLGPERRATYSPFLPISPSTGRVLEVPILHRDPDAGTISARARHLDALARARRHADEALRQLTERHAGELVAEELRGRRVRSG